MLQSSTRGEMEETRTNHSPVNEAARLRTFLRREKERHHEQGRQRANGR